MRQILLFSTFLIFLTFACKKDDASPDFPLVKTIGVERIGFTVATCLVSVDENMDSTISETGVCWSTMGLPTTSDSTSTNKRCYGTDSICNVIMPGLVDDTKYFVRAYCKNIAGQTFYGDTLSLKTLKKEPVTILFQFEFENYAWGRSHFGFYIDDIGNIRGYDIWFENFHDLIRGDEEGNYPKTDLEFNYYLTDTLYGTINPDTLEIMKNLIPGIIDSEFVDDGWLCADFGVQSFHAYFYGNSEFYKKFVLEKTGDICFRNTSTDAMAITNKLIYIYNSIYQDYTAHCNCNYHD